LIISAGYDHTCSITNDLISICWGRNKFIIFIFNLFLNQLKSFGQIGDGTIVFKVYKN
jgi:hypothetical protein